MVFGTRRLTSLVTALALSGSPAVLSACMAACLQPAAAMAHQQGPAAAHAEHTATPPPAAASEHAQHAAPAPPEPAVSAGDSAVSNTALTAACGNCCPDGQIALVAGPGAERTEAHGFASSPLLTPVASFLLRSPAPAATPLSPLAPPRSPVRAPLVLRI